MPRADHAVQIAELLGVSVEYLLTGKDRKDPEARPDESEIIKDLRDLTDNELKTVRSMVHGLAETNRASDRQKQTAG